MTYTFKLARRLAVLFGIAVLVLSSFLLGLHIGSPLIRLPLNVQYWIATALATAVGQIFTVDKGFASSALWLRKTFPNRPPSFYYRANFFLSCVAGTFLGVVIMQPTDVRAAVSAGLCWPAIIRGGKTPV